MREVKKTIRQLDKGKRLELCKKKGSTGCNAGKTRRLAKIVGYGT